MDLSSIEGLNEEQIAAISALHSSDVDGLKNKNAELLSEKEKRAEAVAQSERVAKEAQAAAQKAAEEKLKAEGDFEGYKKTYEERMANEKAELSSALEAKDALILGSHKDAEHAKAMALIADAHKFGVDDKLANVIQVSYNDDGKPQTQYVVGGEVVASSVDEFSGWAANKSDWAGVMRGVDSGGAGISASSTNGSGGVSSKPYNQMTLAEQVKLNSK